MDGFHLERSARTQQQNLAVEIPAGEQLQRLAGVDPPARQAEDKEVGRSSIEHRSQLANPRALASDKAQFFEGLGEERSYVALAVRGTRARSDLALSEAGKAGWSFRSLMAHDLLPQ